MLFGLFAVFGYSLKNAQGLDLKGKFGLTQRLGNQLPLQAKLQDENGRDVKLGDYFGKRPVVLLLGSYTCDGACSTQFENATQTLADIKDKSVGKDFDVVSISIDPRETSFVAGEKKKELLGEYGRAETSEGWHFLTGVQSQVEAVAGALGYKYFYDPVKNQLVNPTGLFIITPRGKISKYYYGVEFVASLVEDSTTAAGQGQIGVANEPVLMACIKYDPDHNKTRNVVFWAIRIGGFSTLIALATSIFLMSRNPSQPKRITEKEDFFRPRS